ncbi:MAG: hypothetical protein HOO06_08460 [Bdellovibrionaceae bacterium]|jgi:hypothetical protein|nr:hypothetical protein [Pseudobdellovibrionaceae bacterium]
MNHLIKSILGASLILTAMSLSAKQTIKADFFDMESKLSKKLFTWEKYVEQKPDGTLVDTSKFISLEGKPLVNRITTFKNSKVVRFEAIQYQNNTRGTIDFKGDKIFFKYFENGKQTKSDDETVDKNLVLPSTLVSHAQKNWKTITKGDTVKVRIAVWHRLDTVGFKMFKVREFTEKGQYIVEVKMKPSSFLIAALVDPLLFRFTKDGSKLLSMKGRVAPKRKVKNKFKDLDAEGVYTHL